MKIAGIDYSIVSPALTILSDGVIENMYAIRATKKQESNNRLITLLDYPLYTTQLERFDKLSSLFLNFIPSDVTYAYIEGYSYGSNVGVVFNIAEATGMMKYKFQKKFGYELIVVPPTQIKKLATSKGTAKKRQMVDQFKIEQFDIYDAFGLVDENKDKITKPFDDICDSYFVAKCGYIQESMQKS